MQNDNIKIGNLIRFDYVKQDGEHSTRIARIEDIQLQPRTGLPYILATELGAQHPKRFSIPSMSNVKLV